jgi:DNA adenine methylase
MNSIISWVGGKKYLRQFIIPQIPKHDLYCEVFGGAGWVLFGKSPDKNDWQINKKVKYTEIYNDINGELVNFWKHIKLHPKAFVTELNEYLVSRQIWDDLNDSKPITEIQRSINFYYLLAMSYGSQSGNFCIKKGKHLPLRNLETVEKAMKRLNNVIIEKKSFEDIINKFDDKNTFFYLDPPYYKREMLYKRDDANTFKEHKKLADMLKNIKGKFLLSYNDTQYIKELYDKFDIKEIQAYYSLGGKAQKQDTYTELIIKNY